MSVYRNRLLRLSLPKGEAAEIPTESNVIRDFLGGKDFGINYLYKNLCRVLIRSARPTSSCLFLEF
ncbi:MAG: hypothetical protein WBJ54_11230 [Syntrophorhabdus sp.]|nr:MAG: hypothetical protein BWX92_02573 [Deltaproteobacteria bacterium ADurb.Bin135]HPW37031.1 hypothetical protein [Syntrophorhabdus sp.]HQB35253.1 hypothetical protein [Syntrophorhabdus sp.]